MAPIPPLRHCTAVGYGGAQVEGRNKASLVECVVTIRDPATGAWEATGERKELLVKFPGVAHMTPATAGRDVLGGALARSFGLDCPESLAVTVSDGFVAATAAEFGARGVRIAAGVAAGAVYIPGMTPLSPKQDLSLAELSAGAAILAFDMLVQNPDRRRTNPNCAKLGERVMAFDHDLAFSFLEPFLLGRPSQAWAVSEFGPMVQDHFFYQALRRKSELCRAVLDKLADLTRDDFADLMATMPAEWSDEAARVIDHVLTVAEHKDEFYTELGRALA